MQYINKKTIIALVIVLVLAGFGGTYYFYSKYRAVTADPSVVAKNETAKLVADVGKLILLPEGESPAVATVQDKEKLASEPFFLNAMNGDKVLIYYVAKKAFLYRPSTNKIIESAPLSVNTKDTTTVATPASETPATTEKPTIIKPTVKK